MKQHKQTNTITTFDCNYENSYGQFVALSDQNEIMRYGHNGAAIYCAEDPPASPVKNKRNNSNKGYINKSSISKYPFPNIEIKSKYQQVVVEFMYGMLWSIFAIIVFTSFYILFFQ